MECWVKVHLPITNTAGATKLFETAQIPSRSYLFRKDHRRYHNPPFLGADKRL